MALPKIIFQAFVTPIPNYVGIEPEKIQQSLLWANSTPKIKHDTLCNDYKDGGLKNVDIRKKIISLQCSWIKKLYDDTFHEWKLTPLHLITKTFGKSFIFHSNLSFKKKLIKSFPSFYKEILLKWKTSFFLEHQKHPPVFCLSFYGIISTFKSMKATYISLGFCKIFELRFSAF